MTVSRLITMLTALPDYAVRSLPERERHALARECRRLLEASEASDRRHSPKSGILAQLSEGERQP